MRMIARFEKGEALRFIGHLDLMRTMQRALRRSALPVSYSKGYNPHQVLSFASALPVGGFGAGEVMDVALEEAVDADVFVDRLNAVLPDGLRVKEARAADDAYPTLMSVVEQADYQVTVTQGYAAGKAYEALVEPFLAQEAIWIERRGKHGLSKQNLAGLIEALQVEAGEGALTMQMRLSSGSRDNVRPEVAAEAFLRFCGETGALSMRCRREALWARRDGKRVSLLAL